MGSVSVDLDGDGDFVDDGETIALESSGGWSTTVDTSKFGADGNKSFLISTTDGTGRTSAETFTFKLDTTPPSRSILAPAEQAPSAAAYWHRGVLALSGEVADGTGSGIASVQVAVTAKGAAPVAGDWKAATFGSGAWNYTYDCGAATEGEKTIHLVATDAVGNALAEATRDFGVDLHDPTLTDLKIDGIAYAGLVYGPREDDPAHRDRGRLAGDPEDRGRGEEARGTPTTPSPRRSPPRPERASLALDWSRSLGASDAEGTYLYRLVAYDTAGNAHTASADATMSVLFDRSAPLAATIGSPPEDRLFRRERPADQGLGPRRRGLGPLEGRMVPGREAPGTRPAARRAGARPST